MSREVLKYILWSLCATLWVGVCFVLPDFLDNPVHDLRSILTIALYVVAISGASWSILYLAGLNRYVAWVAIPLFGIAGAAISYFRVAFHATITPMIIDATLHTNGGTIAGVVSWQLVVWVLINMFIALALVYWRHRTIRLQYAWIHALVAMVILIGYYNAHWHLKAAINQRFPYNVVHSWIEYKRQQQAIHGERSQLAYEAVALPDSLDIVLVIGEAMRADHLSLNGYMRSTTPLLDQRENVVSLPNIYSEYTYTATSIPHILSPADSLHPEWCYSYRSFIATLRENEFTSAWLSNQDNGRTYTSFIHEADTIIFPNANKSVYVFSPWYDANLLPPLDSLMGSKETRRLFVLHSIGSHWYYDLHVPDNCKHFTPLTTDRIITNNTREQVINSYDNTAVYMDVMLDSLIQRFEARNAILIYLSDHGEALGEDGEWLHAGSSLALHNPACIVWFSDKYASAYPDKIKALVANKDKRYRTDFLYYSILSAAGIEAEGDSPKMNIFR